MNELRSPLLFVGAGIVTALTIVALLAPVISPYDPDALGGPSLAAPSPAHPLGTDGLGQDILSRIIWGSRVSLAVGFGAASLGVAVGILVGVGAALLGRKVDVIAMRVVDVFLALPRVPLLVLVAALVGTHLLVLIALIGLTSWPAAARMVRSQALSLRQRGYVAAARGLGGGVPYVLRRHVVPALGPIVVALFVAFAARAMLLQAGLAFLGVGDPTQVSWGLILNRALLEPGLYFTPAWTWWVLPAGCAITVAVLGFTFLGVALEPVMNPRLRRAS